MADPATSSVCVPSVISALFLNILFHINKICIRPMQCNYEVLFHMVLT
jgi:hypothetical protein